jgi:hypothetical protein
MKQSLHLDWLSNLEFETYIGGPLDHPTSTFLVHLTCTGTLLSSTCMIHTQYLPFEIKEQSS